MSEQADPKAREQVERILIENQELQDEYIRLVLGAYEILERPAPRVDGPAPQFYKTL